MSDEGPKPDAIRPVDPVRDALMAKVRERRLASGMSLEDPSPELAARLARAEGESR